jgi:hypothetical protein
MKRELKDDNETLVFIREVKMYGSRCGCRWGGKGGGRGRRDKERNGKSKRKKPLQRRFDRILSLYRSACAADMKTIKRYV